MKCKRCGIEMLVDGAIEKPDKNIVEIRYKCPNKNCSEYGYKEKEKVSVEE